MSEWDRALEARLDREPHTVRRAIAAPATVEVAFPVVALALRRCPRCGERLGDYATFCQADGCVALYEAWADRMGKRRSFDLDDDSEARHFEQMDIEAENKETAHGR